MRRSFVKSDLEVTSNSRMSWKRPMSHWAGLKGRRGCNCATHLSCEHLAGTWPQLRRQEICGTGVPTARQRITNTEPTSTSCVCGGGSVMVGGPAESATRSHHRQTRHRRKPLGQQSPSAPTDTDTRLRHQHTPRDNRQTPADTNRHRHGIYSAESRLHGRQRGRLGSSQAKANVTI